MSVKDKRFRIRRKTTRYQVGASQESIVSYHVDEECDESISPDGWLNLAMNFPTEIDARRFIARQNKPLSVKDEVIAHV